MSDKGFVIEPAAVPLSHQQDSGNPPKVSDDTATNGNSGTRRGIILIALALLALLVLWWVNGRDNNLRPATTASGADSTPAAAAPQPGNDAARAAGKKLAPFAETQQALARTRAQGSLAKFVEQQILLEESMAVGEWGQQRFDAAMARALRGDELFVADKFAEAQSAYDEATTLLADVIVSGQQRVVDALAAGQVALDKRDERTATAAYETALGIDPNNPEAKAGLTRTAQLPAIKKLLLEARNHELAGEWAAAAASYQQILGLDAQTIGIAPALEQAQREVGGDKLRDTLSAGFAALERRQYRGATKKFNAALQMDPGNEVALGGLQQVNARTELASIAALEKEAAAAVSSEDWESAVSAYRKALQMDPNIQFAKAGMRSAVEQSEAAKLLGRIVEEPNKLSSSELLAQGREQLRKARLLEPRGPRLAALLDDSARLLTAYSKPVEVQLTSDNATEILVSTVGKLGTFSNRELSLRPGEYVLLGSRSGCRDVRQTVIVAPGMKPVDIRCREQLPR